ncbi:MAG: hypothetical protein LBI45_06120 [Bacteroidales bacterium]|jgi:hypothetical protein|nr:hypothetical protein [Bacteroidales bacterium]
MEKSKKNIDNQTMLFDLIEKELHHKNLAPVDAVADLLGISYDAAYRRKRGNTPVSLEEAIILCRQFNISLDSIVGVIDTNLIQCRYAPLDLAEPGNYLNFLQVILDSVERIRALPDGEIILSAIDIPQFNILAYKELALFKLFSWSKVYNYPSNYETFVSEFGDNEVINNIHEKIVNNYLLVPSTEVWADGTMDTVLKLLSYYLEAGHFSDKKLPLIICSQVTDLINTLEIRAGRGAKGQKGMPYKLYVSETEVGNTFLIFKNAKSVNCLVRLYTLNHLSTSDERFCGETESWLRRLIQRSTLISETSIKERNRFFNAQRKKVAALIEKIEGEFKD